MKFHSSSWVVLWLFALPGMVYSWGEEGHVISSRIAEAHLTQKARVGIRELLGDKSIADLEVCVWADRIRRSGELKDRYPENATWHYINLDALDDKPDPTAAKLGEHHVLGAINRFRKVLKDRQAPASERKEALLFLIHFVADMHQPLHCTSRHDDRGGNRINVLYPRITEMRRLHGIWDTELVREALGILTTTDYAARLDQRLSDAERKTMLDGEVKNWIIQGHSMAREHVYASIPNDWPLDGKAFEINAEYIKKAIPVIEVQLQRGGLRLAKILNDIFAE